MCNKKTDFWHIDAGKETVHLPSLPCITSSGQNKEMLMTNVTLHNLYTSWHVLDTLLDIAVIFTVIYCESPSVNYLYSK